MTDQDQNYTAQAQRHLAAHMAKLGQTHIAERILEQASAPVFSDDNEEAGFRDSAIDAPVDAGAVSGPEAEPNYEEAKEAARRYAQARNNNARVRSYPQDNESQRAGVASALAWLQRKRKTAIK
jgi:hypothetical protein